MSAQARTFTHDEIDNAMRNDGGFCLACGAEHISGIEQDARNYECEVCGELEVYGAGEIAIGSTVTDTGFEIDPKVFQ